MCKRLDHAVFATLDPGDQLAHAGPGLGQRGFSEEGPQRQVPGMVADDAGVILGIDRPAAGDDDFRATPSSAETSVTWLRFWSS